MRHILLALTGLTLGVAAIGAEAEKGVIDRVVERSFTVGDRASVSIETFYGPVRILRADSPQSREIKVIVRETLDADNEAEADRELKKFELAIEETSPGEIKVQARDRRSVRWSWQKWPPLGLDFEVTVPQRCDVKVFSHEGAIVIPALSGVIEAANDSGAITIGTIEGSATIRAGRGDAAITACSGELHVTALAGNIMIGRADGPTEVHGVGGAIEIQKTRGRLRATGDGSDLKIGFAYPINGDASVTASGGDIMASFEDKISARLSAHASPFGQVRGRDLKFAITSGELGKSSLEAQLGEGGPQISLRASGGNIRLLSVPDF